MSANPRADPAAQHMSSLMSQEMQPHRDASAIGVDVWQDYDAALAQHCVSGGRRGTVGRLNNKFALQPLCVVLCNSD